MATEIKRVRFFDGQFLKEIDFNDEQRYHMYLRRRMNFLLFNQSGVLQVTTDDMRIQVIGPPGDRTFRVLAGMAIGRNTVTLEGKEIILPDVSDPLTLDVNQFPAHSTAFVSVHLEEIESKDPPSEGDVDENTRVNERAVIQVHAAQPPALAPNGEPFIVLGSIAIDTMAVSTAPRQLAFLRQSLISAQAPALPTITSISGTTSAIQGGPSVSLVINGNNLQTATSVSFPGDAAMTAAVVSTSATAATVTVSAGAAATPGTKPILITTEAGSALSPAGVLFTVSGGAKVTSVSGVTTAVQGGPSVAMTINGSNLAGATAVSFPTDPAVTATVTSASANAVNASVTAGAASTPGAKSFVVVTPLGNAASPTGVSLAVTLPVVTPSISGVSGQTTAAQGQSAALVINGTNLAGASSVTFSGDPAVSATITSATATAVNATVTAGAAATPGNKAFVVTTPNGTASSPSGVTFTVNAAPTVTSVSGTTTAVQGSAGVTMVINGTNLGGATAVTFPGDTAVVGAVISSTATTVNVRVTAGATATPGNKAFVVATPNGNVSSPAGVVFTVTGAAAVASVSGATSALQGGSAVDMAINGSNLAGATTVTFPSDPAVTGAVLSSAATVVNVRVQAGVNAVPGTKAFVVATPSGSASSPNNVFFTVRGLPSISNISGATSVAQGAGAVTMVINGANLGGASAVTFTGAGGVSGSIISTSASSVSVSVSASASASLGGRAFTVTTPDGNASSPAGVVLTVTGVTTISSVGGNTSGDRGTTESGFLINGTNLNGASAINFSGTGVSGTINSASTTQVSATVTASGTAATGIRGFSVVTPNGTASTPAGVGFQVTLPKPKDDDKPPLEKINAEKAVPIEKIAPIEQPQVLGISADLGHGSLGGTKAAPTEEAVGRAFITPDERPAVAANLSVTEEPS